MSECSVPSRRLSEPSLPHDLMTLGFLAVGHTAIFQSLAISISEHLELKQAKVPFKVGPKRGVSRSNATVALCVNVYGVC